MNCFLLQISSPVRIYGAWMATLCRVAEFPSIRPHLPLGTGPHLQLSSASLMIVSSSCTTLGCDASRDLQQVADAALWHKTCLSAHGLRSQNTEAAYALSELPEHIYVEMYSSARKHCFFVLDQGSTSGKVRPAES